MVHPRIEPTPEHSTASIDRMATLAATMLIGLGAALGALLIVVVRTVRNRFPSLGENRAYAVGLSLTALLYVAWAYTGPGGGALAAECLGFTIYTAAAFIGSRRPVILGAAWI